MMTKIEIILTVISAVGVVLGGIWFMFKSIFLSGKNSHRVDSLEKKVTLYEEKHSDCEKRFISLETKKAEDLVIQRRLDEIIYSIKELQLPLAKKIITDPFIDTHSPLSLTQKGIEKSKELNIEEMIDKNWEQISNLISTHSSSTTNPYDIQQLCLVECVVTPTDFLNENDLDVIKRDAYNTGSSLELYMQIVAVIIRDRYFKENNIDPSEVDIHDPNK